MLDLARRADRAAESKARASTTWRAAYAGITASIGEADRGPAQFTTAIGDSATGMTAAMAIGFALLHRERTGEGQYIECSLIDTYFHMHEVNVPEGRRCAAVVRAEARGLAPSRRRADRNIPLQRR